MQRKLTITVVDDVNRGLPQQIVRGEISRFIENLVQPYVVATNELEAEYRAAAEGATVEQEAADWIEARVDEALDYCAAGMSTGSNSIPRAAARSSSAGQQ
jgi:hypothetical protein